ncbi:MAG TPA: magnesium-translocating P-type ATPase [Candidatus Binatia bacterium]|nr:magnesium-translocating P-type ATPase [Candidatus Binatia bacterium]
MEIASLSFKEAAAAAPQDLASKLGADPSKGLTDEEAERRREASGRNEIGHQRKTAGEIFLRQLTSPFIYLLGVAAAVAFATGEHFDASMIVLFTAINTGLGFYQEFRAEKAVELLMKYWRQNTHALRGGKTRLIDSSELVPGDIVHLQAGDKVPADVRFLSVTDLSIDESILTGESVDVYKDTGAMAKAPGEYFEATNVGFSGTSVLTGEGTAVVFATGKHAALGEIAKLTSEAKATSAFEKEIAGFSSFIMKLVVVTIAFMFGLNLVLKGTGQLQELLLFSIALTVGVIPEALPVVSTVSLSRGAIRLARRKVVVKRLSAIDDLGSIDILCTDKTGTITKNELVVADVLAVDKDACLRYALLASSFIGEHEKQQNNAFDVALWEKAGEAVRDEAGKAEKLGELPFDPVRRRNSVLLRSAERGTVLVSRGSPDEVLKLCTNVKDMEGLSRYRVEQGLAGNRVIAVTVRWGVPEGTDLKNEEHNLELVGLLSFQDPLKESAKEAAEKAKRLGVQIKILTGDSKEVAGAVAYKIGIIPDPHAVLTGADLETLSVEDRHRAVHETHVFARMNPKQKFTVLSLLQETKAVGFLGEGFNDAPGLKMANVGLAVEGASDIAREAADVILLNPSLNVIFDGVEEGRRTFANTIKYLKVTLASNFGNFYSVAIASLLVNYLPMLPLQILLLNLLSDFPMITIATDSVDASELRDPKKYDARHIIIFTTILGLVSSIFDFTTFAVFRLFSPAVLQTSWFMVSVLTELVLIYSLRTSGPFYKAPPPPAHLATLTACAAIAAVVLPYSSFGHKVFHFVTPRPLHLLIAVLIVAVYFIATETVKLWLYRAGERAADAMHKK